MPYNERDKVSTGALTKDGTAVIGSDGGEEFMSGRTPEGGYAGGGGVGGEGLVVFVGVDEQGIVAE